MTTDNVRVPDLANWAQHYSIHPAALSALQSLLAAPAPAVVQDDEDGMNETVGELLAKGFKVTIEPGDDRIVTVRPDGSAEVVDADSRTIEEWPAGTFKPEPGAGLPLPEQLQSPPCPVWLDEPSHAWAAGWEAGVKFALARQQSRVVDALIEAAEEIEGGHAWISAVAASVIIRKHAAALEGGRDGG